MMNRIGYLAINLVCTLLRMLPIPSKTGLFSIGAPDGSSPVFLTCNYLLTVARLRRALTGLDAYLLVANSRGVNVWCASTGGLFTTQEVVSVLKTSGIDRLVRHRRVILPQLAATGVEARLVRRETGWSVVWGPVYASSIHRFVKGGLKKSRAMRTVGFPAVARLEMAAAWAFPISLLSLCLIPVWPEGVLPLAGLVWALSFAVFLAFPLYRSRLPQSGKNVGFVFFDFGKRGLPLLVWGLFMGSLAVWSASSGALSTASLLRWGLSSLIVLLILGMDLMGSTPLFKSGLHGDSLLAVSLDASRCRAAGVCEEVCPMDVFDLGIHPGRAAMPGAARCVRCGACIVQCPFDALSFRGPGGDAVSPETVRKYKLDLRGERSRPAR